MISGWHDNAATSNAQMPGLAAGPSMTTTYSHSRTPWQESLGSINSQIYEPQTLHGVMPTVSDAGISYMPEQAQWDQQVSLHKLAAWSLYNLERS